VAVARRRIFQSRTPLSRELQALYDLWDKGTPTLFDPLAVALCVEERFCKLEDLRLEVDNEGFTRVGKGPFNARVATSVEREKFLDWFVDRLAARSSSEPKGKADNKASKLTQLIPINTAGAAELQRLPRIGPTLAQRILAERRKAPFRSVDDLRRVRGIGAKTLERLLPFITVENIPRNVATPVVRAGFPNRVHFIEDFETDIGQRWWLCGKIGNEAADSRRACRGVLTNDFDDRMGDAQASYKAVVIKPVPTPSMGKHSRLTFRCRLKGADNLRVQVQSLTRGYHRHLVVNDLTQDRWHDITLDLTQARRLDGGGGPLAENERIGDLQFYTDALADLLVDDVVVYDAAAPGEKRPFPARFLYTAWFDNGAQGKDWPGSFEIVAKPQGGMAARSVQDPKSGADGIRLHLRGKRPVTKSTQLRFRYHLRGANELRVQLCKAGSAIAPASAVVGLTQDAWAEATVPIGAAGWQPDDRMDEVCFLLARGAKLLVDDVVIFEPRK
jgi:competence ComEA-like helix-hairpin-helix protein